MRLLLVRFLATDHSTIGRLFVDGAPQCYTLEDAVRWPGQKVQGATAIDPGTYKVVIDMSTRFGRLMPHVLDVPGFSGIRIHSGNTDADTSGCILVGEEYATDRISNSRAAFAPLYQMISGALDAGEEVTLEIMEQSSGSEPSSVKGDTQ